MDHSQETRGSLLLRVRDPADQAAWAEFVEIYRPLVWRLARRMGMQDADADDVAQQVLLRVAKAMEQREHDRQRARFRTWLHQVARNAILSALSRAKPDRAAADSAQRAALQQLGAADGPDSDLLRLEHRREVFRWAARQVRPEFHEDTWLAFWRTAVEGGDCQAVGERLGKNRGAVYAARSRVMRRIQEKVRKYERQQ